MDLTGFISIFMIVFLFYCGLIIVSHIAENIRLRILRKGQRRTRLASYLIGDDSN